MTTTHNASTFMLYRLKSPLFLLLLILFILTFFVGCGSTMEVASVPIVDAPKIDGNDADWEGKTWYVKDKNASVGFQHNGDMLYVFFKTGERSTQMQILRGGMTVWLDPEGGSDEYMGIRYPLRRPGGPGMAPGRPDGEAGDPDADEARRISMEAVKECEILGPGDDDIRIAPLYEHGIKAQLSMKAGVLIYEMQIPLGDTELGLPKAGANGIGVGFSTARRDGDKQETARDRMERNQGGMGQRPGGMQPGGMPGGMGRPSGAHMMMRDGVTPLELWLDVKM